MRIENFRRAALLSIFGALSVILTAETLSTATTAHAGFQADFRGDLYAAAHAILRGVSPYHPGLIQRQASVLAAGGHWGLTISPRYPPISMLAVVPVSLLPFKIAGVIWMLGCAAALIGALWLLEVCDPRCYIVVAVSSPAAYGIWIGQITAWLLLGAAIIWKLRDDRRLLPIAMAFAVGVKLFLWPLGAWLVLVRRYRAFAITVGLTFVFLLGSWAVIQFHGLADYPGLLANVAVVGELRGSSLVTQLMHLGMESWMARGLALAIACSMVGAGAAMLDRADGQRRAFGLIVLAAVLASPVVWVHSLLLLFVPIALISPRLSLFWFVPALATFSPAGDSVLETIVAAVLCAPLLETRAIDAAVALRGRQLGLARMLLAPM
jgi:hypothetical protein